MKKAFLVFSLCLVLALAGLTAAAVTLHDSRDDVEVTLTTRAGDPFQAQGLTVQQQARFADSLLWNLTIPAHDPVLAKTDCSYYARGLEWTVHEETPLSLYTNESSVHYIDGPHTDLTADVVAGDSALSQLVPLLNELAEQTQPGKSFSRTIPPSDYLDAIPYSVYASLPNTALRYDENTLDHHDTEGMIPRFFQKAFPLDFAPEEVWTVSVKKRTTGYIEEASYSSNGPTPQVDLITDYNDQALYLALGQDTWPQPDYSRFPQGNGVYRMDITQGEKQELDYMEVQSLTNIFPIPDEAMVLDLTLDGAGSLLVTWYDAGDYRCTILDTETLEPTETFTLFHLPWSFSEVIVYDNYSDEEYSYETRSYVYLRAIPKENCILFLGETQLWLFLPTEEGWQEQFHVRLGDSLYFPYYSDKQVDIAWNGEKLALASTSSMWTVGLDLLVYDDTGELLFNGRYDSSLTEQPDEEGYRGTGDVVLMDGEEISLAWE